MQGLWKENLGGWNHKDTKRKSQTRRNSFNDKAQGIASRCGTIWRFNSKASKKHRNSKYDFYILPNGKEERYIKSIYGIKFESGREWYSVYPESQGLRKNAQKLANRTTRAKLKQWLSKKDYDMDIEIECHSLQKSIAWEIH